MVKKFFHYITLIFYPILYVYLRFLKVHFQELSGDYVKSRIKNKGHDLRIHGLIDVHDFDKLKIGDFCRIGRGAFFFCKGGLKIGNNVQFSRNVTIYTANHNFKTNIYPYNDDYLEKQVTIEDNVWIGMNVSILPGVRICKNSIIGMGSIITKDVPDNAIVVGNNRIIGYRKNNNDNYKQFGRLFPDS
ncbi:MAG: acyltransferase [Paludibacter sp.]|nr:acyltransferase [Paludibacter sp.]